MEDDSAADQSVDRSSRARDHMANERTYLAWLRTAANIMIVGLVVARFGAGGKVTATTLAAGGMLLAVVAAGVVYGTMRYRAVSRELEAGEYVTGGQSTGPTLAAVILVLALLATLGLLLADGFG
ncbi:MAG: DUF202 domain-containing protein [Nocardioidaceae bacterium]|nr:DUF202 domain-containing protein [Nocardioidaceae bacterium]